MFPACPSKSLRLLACRAIYLCAEFAPQMFHVNCSVGSSQPVTQPRGRDNLLVASTMFVGTQPANVFVCSQSYGRPNFNQLLPGEKVWVHLLGNLLDFCADGACHLQRPFAGSICLLHIFCTPDQALL